MRETDRDRVQPKRFMKRVIGHSVRQSHESCVCEYSSWNLDGIRWMVYGGWKDGGRLRQGRERGRMEDEGRG